MQEVVVPIGKHSMRLHLPALQNCEAEQEARLEISKAPVSFFSIKVMKSAVSRVDDATASSRAATSTMKLISGVGAGEAAARVRRPAMMIEIFMVVVVRYIDLRIYLKREALDRGGGLLIIMDCRRGSEFLMGIEIDGGRD